MSVILRSNEGAKGMSIRLEIERCSEVLCLVAVNTWFFSSLGCQVWENLDLSLLAGGRGWLVASVRLEIMVDTLSPVSFFGFIQERLNWPTFHYDFIFIFSSY